MTYAIAGRLRARWWIVAALAAPWGGCASEASSPRLEPALPPPSAGAVRAVGDSADVATWGARRDAALARLAADGASRLVSDRVDAARCTRNLALALAGPAQRADELARADALAREAVRAAPTEPGARFWVARIALDRFREGQADGRALVEAHWLLAALVTENRAFGGGAALGSLAEAYALAGAARSDASELERAAAFFEATLDVAPGYRPALLGYAEGVLEPWGDSASASRRLGECAALPLAGAADDGQRLVDEDRAQRRCTRRIGAADDASRTLPVR